MTEQPTRVWIWEWVKSLAVAVVVWLILRTFVIEAFHIPSGSMENTLLIGDFLFVNKALYGAEVPLIHKTLPAFREPRHGDVVIFDSVEEPIEVVKRLIGMPGDTLEMRGGVVYRNGSALSEPYALNTDPTKSESPIMREKMRTWQLPHLVPGVDTSSYQPDLHEWGPIVVPPESLFVMGDNRDDSYDSRYWGFLPRKSVRGRPLVIYYSYDPGSWKALPFLSAVRWGRIFSVPR